MTQKHQFCFDISFDEKLGFYVPTAYIIDNVGIINYVDKKATPTIIKSFGLTTEDLDADIIVLLNIIEILKPENLYKKFEKNPKAKKNIIDLLKDDKIGLVVKNYIDRKSTRLNSSHVD